MQHRSRPFAVIPCIPRRIDWFWPALFLIAALVIGLYVPGIEWRMPRVSLAEQMTGEAHRPFIYRVLVAALVKLGVLLFPLDYRLIAAGLIYISLVGAVASLRGLYRLIWPTAPHANLVALGAVVAMAPLMVTSRHTYDLPVLFLTALTIVLALQRRPRWLLAVFALACLAKETAVLLVPVLVLATGLQREGWRLGGMLLGVYALIRGALLWHFRASPGDLVEPHLMANINSAIHNPYLAGAYIGLGTVVLFACLYRHQEKPTWLRLSALWLVACLVPLYVLYGAIFEIRVFYEAFPVWYLLSLPPQLYAPRSIAASPVER